MKDTAPIPRADLRPPDEVMRLSRLGAMFPTRLSFLRSLLRRLAADGVTVARPVWRMDAAGFGHAVYTLRLGGHPYALVAVSTDLPAEQRTDRVIATAWDTAFVLYDGIPDQAEIDRIVATAPLQEAARFTPRDLVLSRANKSVRLFAHVTEALRAGRQPDAEKIRDIGYLMRTTAVYGNGKFGLADRQLITDRGGLEGPFAAEMLCVWLIRHFTHDLAEHVGNGRIDRGLRRHLGIGNATGLGMAPFLVTHPVLLHNWMIARETALARVRALDRLTPSRQDRVHALAARAEAHLHEWQVPDRDQQSRIAQLRADWASARRRLDLAGARPLDRAMRGVAGASLDLQELMVALVIEPFGPLVDDLAGRMADPFGPLCPPLAGTHALRAAIEGQCAWALAPDYTTVEGCRQFWYVSAAKQEPRLGDRFAEPGAEQETPLDIGRRIKALHAVLPGRDAPLHAFLADHPEHALAAARVALLLRYPYGEIRDNLIGADCLPIDMLRCKLAFFGASKFDPKSDRWTRITLCQGAPLADELGNDADDWWLPVFAP
ncbi:hypothetical protein BOO69_13145 [Sulfitobacter alexandrii]|uniref:Uncharacterized protein n=1 Tax=Sulfitobacter alexandrii TaxID=1917485 RepID=A0A1J0WJA2_9RHOB|nr:hypothetical protein [Sulfitobacter alexandrii]APE44238.1 hypothetical protein BOO69_13145 [Sulfitobacter alexandrii]